MNNEEDDTLKNTRNFFMKMYDDFQPLRDIIAKYPELKEDIVKEIEKAMTQVFAKDFYAGMKP